LIREMRLLRENPFTGKNCLSIIWMRAPDDHVIVGTESGQLLIFNSGEYLYEMQNSPGKMITLVILSLATTLIVVIWYVNQVQIILFIHW
jgi:hypothetical protein